MKAANGFHLRTLISHNQRSLPPDIQAQLTERTDETIDIPTSHSPFFSRPEPVADLFARHARARQGRGFNAPLPLSVMRTTRKLLSSPSRR
jgi:hypothetical protein